MLVYILVLSILVSCMRFQCASVVLERSLRCSTTVQGGVVDNFSGSQCVVDKSVVDNLACG
jgi:hypothetical protein